MADILKEDGNACSSEDDEWADVRNASELYSEAQIAVRSLRFSVGDVVECCMTVGTAEGVVVARCYREDQWPRGRYAAVRSRFKAPASASAPLDLVCSCHCSRLDQQTSDVIAWHTHLP